MWVAACVAIALSLTCALLDGAWAAAPNDYAPTLSAPAGWSVGLAFDLTADTWLGAAAAAASDARFTVRVTATLPGVVLSVAAHPPDYAATTSVALAFGTPQLTLSGLTLDAARALLSTLTYTRPAHVLGADTVTLVVADAHGERIAAARATAIGGGRGGGGGGDDDAVVGQREAQVLEVRLGDEHRSTPLVSTVIGSPTGSAGLADGAGPSALLSAPRGMAFAPFPADDSVLFVADSANHALRRVVLSDMPPTVSVVAGDPLTPTAGTADHATGTVARFNAPSAVRVDAFDVAQPLLVVDTANSAVRRVESTTPYGTQTIAGVIGSAGFADGALLSAQFDGPMDIAVNA